MKNNQKQRGRPALTEGKRIWKIDARFTEEEYAKIVRLEKELGIKRAELIRSRVLDSASQHLVNAREMMAALDFIGAELGRSGNNINQLARYANILRKQNTLSQAVIERFLILLETYHQNQANLEVTLRKIIRLMTRS